MKGSNKQKCTLSIQDSLFSHICFLIFYDIPEDTVDNGIIEDDDDFDTAFWISFMVSVGVYILTRPLTRLTMLIDLPTLVSIFLGTEDLIFPRLVSTSTKSSNRHPRKEIF